MEFRQTTLRKWNKLIRNPKLFMYDYLRKRIEIEEVLPTNTIVKRHPERININKPSIYIKELKNIVEELIEYLLSHTCFIQTIPLSDTNSIRIAVKQTDLAWILKKINEFNSNEFKIYYEPLNITNNYSSIITCYIEDEKNRYLDPVIQLDPWFHRSGRIYTLNYNSYVTHIDEIDINKTVYSPNPYFLQGEINTSDICIKKMMNLSTPVLDDFSFPVDIVFTWVDGNDPKWLLKKNAIIKNYSGNPENNDKARFEQIEELRYSLRSIASYFKEYRNIYIVTDEQSPYWLDITHPKIKIIDHKSIFPNNDILPVFNSHAIESNLHNIVGLSEHFIYMNDDVFFWNKSSKKDFFYSNGISKSRFESISNINGSPNDRFPAWRNAALQGNKLLNKDYGLSGYSYHQHCPHALNKNILNLMWSNFKDKLDETSSNKIRSINDISPVSFFYHYFSFINGKSIPVNGNTLTANSGNDIHIQHLKEHCFSSTYDFVCINDGGEKRKDKLILDILNKKFPNRAEWELI